MDTGFVLRPGMWVEYAPTEMGSVSELVASVTRSASDDQLFITFAEGSQINLNFKGGKVSLIFLMPVAEAKGRNLSQATVGFGSQILHRYTTGS